MLHQTFIDLSTRQFLDYFIQTRSFALKSAGFPSHSFGSQGIYTSRKVSKEIDYTDIIRWNTIHGKYAICI